MPATIDDTYAEAFRSIYAAVLVTARDRYWLDMAVQAATGNASSAIMCDCEAGLDRYVPEAETPDGRPGAVVQFHVPRFHKDREVRLERAVLVRVAQNVLTCPTAAAFNVLDASGSWYASQQPPKPGGKWFPLGASWPTSATATSTPRSGTVGAAVWCPSSAVNSSANGVAGSPTG